MKAVNNHSKHLLYLLGLSLAFLLVFFSSEETMAQCNPRTDAALEAPPQNEGCFPFSVTYNDSSRNYQDSTRFIMRYGDGTVVDYGIHDTTFTIESHTYNFTGCDSTGNLTSLRDTLVAITYCNGNIDSTRAFYTPINIYSPIIPKIIVDDVFEKCLPTSGGSVTFNLDNSSWPNLCGSNGTDYIWRFYDSEGVLLDSEVYFEVAHNTSGLQQNDVTSYAFTEVGSYKIVLEAVEEPNSDNECGTKYDTVEVEVGRTPLASFTFDPLGSKSCKDEVIAFTNTSTGDTLSYTWTITGGTEGTDWDFANGTDADDEDIDIEFKTKGSYDVKLDITNDCGSSTVTHTIAVKDVPIVTINDIANACEPHTINPSATFDDGGGTITGSSYNWTFTGGSPTSSNQRSPGAVTYNAHGSYTISLTAANECGTSVADTEGFDVFDKPLASFTVSDTEVCENEDIQFTGSSSVNSIPGGSSTVDIHEWDFSYTGSNFIPESGVTASNPTTSFATAGTYVVAYRVRTSDGCVSDIFERTITVNDVPVATITSSNHGACENSPISFTGSSDIGVSAYEWDFQYASPNFDLDGTGQTTQNTYSTSDTYTVGFRVRTNEGCESDVVTTTAAVYDIPVVDFTTSPSTICEGESIEFTGSTTSLATTPGNNTVATHAWDFDYDGSNFNPSGTATTSNPTQSFSTSKTYEVGYQVTTNEGCVSEIVQKQVVVNEVPVASITSTDHDACENVAINFTGSADIAVTNYEWDFDFPSSSSTFDVDSDQQNPAHTYADHDEYRVGLRVITAEGCTSTVATTAVDIYDIPVVDFTPSKTEICEGESVTFTGNTTSLSASPGSSSVTIHEWDFDYDGTFDVDATASGSAPSHTFTTSRTTPYRVAYRVRTNNGCESAIVEKDITVNEVPTATISTVNPSDCEAKVITFTGSADIAVNSYEWDFNYNGTDFDTPSGSGASATHTYTAHGTYTVGFRVTTAKNCTSPIVTTTATVYDIPTADFNIDDETVCEGITVSFTGSSSVDDASTIDTHEWDFSYDGNSFTPESGVSISNPTRIFSSPGTFQVAYRVKTNNDCESPIVEKTVTVYEIPSVTIDITDADVCEGETVSLGRTLATMTGPGDNTISNYEWDFDYDGSSFDVESTSNTTAVTTSYANHAVYTVALRVTTGNNCVSTIATSDVTVFDIPVATLSASDNEVCENEEITFNGDGTVNSVAGKPASTIATYQWDFDHGASFVVDGDANGTEEKHTYTTFGDKTTAFRVISSNGCTSPEVIESITVNDIPVAEFTASATSICEGSSITFDATDSDVNAGSNSNTIQAYEWDLDYSGTPLNFDVDRSGTSATLTETFNMQGDFTIALRVRSARGCVSEVFTLDISVLGEPAADFDIDDASVCAGETISFDASNSGTVETYHWDFDYDGTTFAIDQTLTDDATVDRTFATAGEFDVALQVITADACSSQVVSKPVTIYANPTASFTIYDATVCEDTPINFDGSGSSVTSAPGSSTISQYAWDFDLDGSFVADETNNAPTSSAAHTYTEEGDYNVALQVTTNHGCTSTVVQQPVDIYDQPIAAFDITDSDVCDGESLEFIASTSSIQSDPANSTIDDYEWNFIYNGSSFVVDATLNGSSNHTTNHTYTTGSGEYDVALRVTSSEGCVSELAQSQATVFANPVASFTVSDATVCDGTEVTFNAVASNVATSPGSSSITTYEWDFDYDGTFDETNKVTSSSANTDHTFQGEKTYRVALRVKTNNDCVSPIVEQTVEVYAQPVAQFMIDDNEVCDDTEITFDASTSSVVNTPGNSTLTTYEWDYEYDTNANFAADISGADADPKHTYAGKGSYTVALRVTSSNNCVSEIVSKPVTVFANPVAGLTVTDPDVCDGTAVAFDGSSSSVSNDAATNTIRDYLWDFEYDGSNFSSDQTTNHPTATNSHTYPSHGDYQVALQVVSSQNCSSAVVQEAIVIFDNPVADFTIDDNDVCDGTEISFDAQPSTVVADPGGSTINTYVWDFDYDNTTLDTDAAVEAPAHTYALPNDTYTVALQVTTNNQCSSGIVTKTLAVHPNPTASFTAEDQCAGNDIQFASTSTIPSGRTATYVWDFYGDGSQTGTGQTTTFDYAQTVGDYTPKLTVTTNNLCTDEVSGNVSIKAVPVARFTFTNACENSAVALDASTSQGATDYNWDFTQGGVDDFDDANLTTDTTSHDFGAAGTYDVALEVVTGICRDSTTQTIRVYPIPEARIQVTNACVGTAAGLDGSGSVVASPSAIRDYEWEFDTDNDFNDATVANTSHDFGAANSYTAKLRVTADSGNCSDEATATVLMHPNPVAGFNITNTCFGNNTELKSTSTLASVGASQMETYTWDIDGTQDKTGTDDFLNKQFAAAQTYSVKMTVETDSGCTDDITQDVVISPLPVAAFDITNACAGEDVKLNASASSVSNSSTLSYAWDLDQGGDFADASGINVDHDFGGTPDTHPVTLQVTTSDNCSTTVTKNAIVHPNPVAEFEVEDDCADTLITFDAQNSAVTDHSGIGYKITDWDWEFTGDDQFDDDSNESVSQAFAAGSLTAKLRVTTDSGCTDIADENVNIFTNPIVDFDITGNCEDESIAFSVNVIQGTIDGFNWNFGTGLNTDNQSLAGNTTSTTFQYQDDGTYTIRLEAFTADGCTAVVEKSHVINPKADVQFTVLPQCAEQTASFDASGTTLSSTTIANYAWDMDGETTIAGSNASPQYTFATEGNKNITLTITTDSGCVSSLSKTLDIYPNPVAAFSFTDDCQGKDIGFNSSSTVSDAVFDPSSISQTLWDMDADGLHDELTGAAVTQSFLDSGLQTVSMIVISNHNCRDTLAQDVHIFPNPVAKFSANPVCETNATNFTNQSEIPTGYTATYSWDFAEAGASASTEVSPSFTYQEDGLYGVSLTATTNENCVADTTIQIEVYPNAIADFTFENACDGTEIVFKDSSNLPSGFSITDYEWDFDKGSVISIDESGADKDEVTHTYAGPGQYTVFYRVTTNTSCESIKEKNITIFNNPNADFVFSNACEDSTVTFDASGSAVGGGYTIDDYAWDFERDGTTDTNGATPTASKAYNSPSTYDVFLTVTTNENCTDTISRSITIYNNPTASFSFSQNHCVDSLINFESTATISGVGESLNTWDWQIDDGGNQVIRSTEDFDLAFENPGNHTVTLKVTSTNDCSDEVTQTVTAYPNPDANLQIQDACVDQSFVLDASGSDIDPFGSIATYQWDSDSDGVLNGSQISNATRNNEINTPGTYDLFVEVTATDGGCKDTAHATVIIHPEPVVDFVTENVCADSVATFRSTSSLLFGSLDQLEWDFDQDNNIDVDKNYPDSTAQFIYTSPGDKDITLRLTSAFGCTSQATKSIKIHPNPTADFTVDPVCELDTSTFEDASSITDGTIISYEWDFTQDGVYTDTGKVVTNYFEFPGDQDVTLKITSDSGCIVSVTKAARIDSNPIPDISGADVVCENDQEVAYDVLADVTRSYQWQVFGGVFADGINDTRAVKVNWGSSGTGILVIREENTSTGCFFFDTLEVTINPQPVPNIALPPDSVCSNQAGYVYQTPDVNNNSYTWEIFGGAITAGQNTNEVTVTWQDSLEDAWLKVTEVVGGSGCEQFDSVGIIIYQTPTPLITGDTSLCEFTTAQVYETPNTPGHTFGWSITGGVITDTLNNQINLDWQAAGTGTLSVLETNPTTTCFATADTSITLHPNPNPQIQGDSAFCAFAPTTLYNLANPSNLPSHTYTWTLAGGDLAAGSTPGDAQINVNWLDSNALASVIVNEEIAYAGADCAVEDTLQVVVFENPDPIISGKTQVCALDTAAVYQVDNPVSGHQYSWTATNGTIVGSSNQTTVTVNWHGEEQGGIDLQGRLTLVQTNPTTGCDTTLQYNVLIKPNPVPQITGEFTVCEVDVKLYRDSLQSPDHYYRWQQLGGTMESDSVEDEVSVRWAAQGTGELVLFDSILATGCTSLDTQQVNINPIPTPAIAPDSAGCAFQSETLYSAAFVAGNTYRWSVTGGDSLDSPAPNELNVRWAAAGTGNIELIEEIQGTGCADTVNVDITIDPSPTPDIQGTDLLCTNDSIQQYTVAQNAGHSYQWFVTGGVIDGADDQNTVNVIWSDTGDVAIGLVETIDVSNCAVADTFSARVRLSPTPAIAGEDTACAYRQQAYSTPVVNLPQNVTNRTFQWEATNATFNGNTDLDTVALVWGMSADNNPITVTETWQYAGIDCPTDTSLLVRIDPTPTASIIGDDEVCGRDSGIVYKINPIADHSYDWRVTNGAIAGSNDLDSVVIHWDGSETGGSDITAEVSLLLTNNLTGCDSLIVFPVTIKPNPETNIIGVSTLCVDAQENYITNFNQGNSYQWFYDGAATEVSQTANSIDMSWDAPSDTAFVRLIETVDTTGCFTERIKNITVNPLPTPDIILPEDSVCSNIEGYVYETALVSGNTYFWEIEGGTITAGNNTEQVTVRWGDAGPGKISVTESIPFPSNCSLKDEVNLTINQSPTPQIIGNEFVCEGDTLTYQTAEVAGHSYDWSLAGGQFVDSTGHAVSLIWGQADTAVIALTETDPATTCATPTTDTIVIHPDPTPTVAGEDTLCAYTLAEGYHTAATPGHFYQWSVSGGAFSDGINDQDTVTIDWAGAVSATENRLGVVRVTETIRYDTVNCAVLDTLPVLIRPNPIIEIMGRNEVCEFDEAEPYHTSDSVNADFSYQWSLNQGGMIVSDTTASSILIDFGSETSMMLSLTQLIDSTGCDTTATLAIQSFPEPEPSIDSTNAVVCELTSGVTYSIPNTAGHSFEWQLLNNRGTITSATNTSSITIDWGAAIDSLTQAIDTIVVRETIDATQCFFLDTLVVAINPRPRPQIIDLNVDSVCSDKAGYRYETTYVPGNSYQWTITEGTITSPADSNVVFVRWGDEGEGTLRVVEKIEASDCEESHEITRTIYKSPEPEIISVITGDDIVCAFDLGKSYQVTQKTKPINTFGWEINGLASIDGLNTDTAVTLNFGDAGVDTLIVTEENPVSFCSITDTFLITVNAIPYPDISGAESVCEWDEIQSYSTANNPPNDYAWTILSGDGEITSSSDTENVRVKWKSHGSAELEIIETINHANGRSCPNSDTIGVTINPKPYPVIEGTNAVCALDQNVTYNVKDVFPDRSYVWGVTGGEIVAYNADSSQITINWFESQDSINNSIAVITLTEAYETTLCDSTVTYDVTIRPNPVIIVVGDTVVCEQDTKNYYDASTALNANMSWDWNVTGGTPANPTGQNITVNWGNLNPDAQLILTKTNGNTTCSSADTVPITINAIPQPAITGTDTVCEEEIYLFQTNNNPGNSYIWSVDAGGQILAQRRNEVDLYWPDPVVTTTITVREEIGTTGCFNSTSVTRTVESKPDPVILKVTADSVCERTFRSFRIGSSTTTSKVWRIEPATAGNIVAGQGTNQIRVDWRQSGNASVIVEEIINATQCSREDTFDLFVHPRPVPRIEGDKTVCEGAIDQVYRDPVSTDRAFQWTVVGGTVNGSSTADSIVVTWDQGITGADGKTRGFITLVKTNTITDCDTILFDTVTINKIPTALFELDNVCFGSNVVMDADSSFTNEPGANLTDYSWEFKDVVPTTNGSGVIVSFGYSQPGIFYPKLTIKDNNGCQDTLTKAVTVFDAPRPSFVREADNKITQKQILCDGNLVQFEDGSSPSNNPPGGAINEWFWQFGDPDNNSSTLQDPTFTFPFADTFDVRLEVTDINGCSNDTIIPVVIHPLPDVGFSFTPACDGFPVTFQDTSSAGDFPLKFFRWDLGETGSAISGTTNFIHQYDSAGTYRVRLSVEDDAACVDSVIHFVSVTPNPTASFAFDTVCFGEITTFTDLSDVNTIPAIPNVNLEEWYWDFGNGIGRDTIIDEADGSTDYQYPASNDYSVTLRIQDSQGCEDTLTLDHVIVRPSPVPEFESDSVCQGNPTPFTDLSLPGDGPGASEIQRWDWVFGDGNDTTLLRTDPRTNGDIDHLYDTTNHYVVTLTIFDCNDCSSSFTDTVVVHPLPIPSFFFDTISCVEVPVPFENESIIDTINYWIWGDGNMDTTGTESPVFHTYLDTGYFDIKLINETQYGCQDSLTQEIEIIAPPEALFTIEPVEPDTGCAPLSVWFNNQSVGKYVQYHWDFGNGQFSDERVPDTITYQQGILTDTTYYITLQVFNKCDTSTFVDSVIVFPTPIVEFATNVDDGCNPLSVDFINKTTGHRKDEETKYRWEMGNGVTTSAEHAASQVYEVVNNRPTIYNIKLRAWNSCGVDSLTRSVTVYPDTLEAGFSADTLFGCAPFEVTFVDTYRFTTNSTFDFGDGEVQTGDTVTHTFNTGGSYQVIQIVTNGCAYDTAIINVNVFPQPNLDFGFDKDSICVGEEVTVINFSSPLAQADWDMGDGTAFSNTAETFTHVYADSGEYRVRLIGGSAQHGCLDTAFNSLYVKATPATSFTPSVEAGCQPLTLDFDNQTTDGAYYLWNMGEGTTLTDTSFTFTYDTVGTFVVRLESRNEQSVCSSEFRDTITVHPKPGAAYSTDSVGSCYSPVTVQFNNVDNGIGNVIAYGWDFDNGDTSDVANPTTNFNTAREYVITHIVGTDFGCLDTLEQIYGVYPQPVAAFAQDTVGCAPFAVPFANETAKAIDYLWVFGDGDSSFVADPIHTFLDSGLYQVTLFATNGVCVDSATREVTVNPTPLANFDYENLILPKPEGRVQFTDLSEGSVQRWEWQLPDDSVAMEQNPIYRFPDFGTYQVTLTAFNQHDCPDDTTRVIEVDYFKGLYIPNAFMPDAGGSFLEYTRFRPKGRGLETMLIQVFDKWGKVIWETNALDSDGRPTGFWDGIHKDTGEPVPAGSYIWKASATFIDGTQWAGQVINRSGPPKRVGTVTIVR